MTYILDLDHTLLNTTALKRAMQESLRPFGGSGELFEKSYAATVSAIPGQYDYDISRHASIISEMTGADAALVRAALENVLQHIDKFLFPDAISFLQWVKEKGAVLLLTWGNPHWQEQKVQHSSIRDMFVRCVYTEKDKHNVALAIDAPQAEWIFINDNPKEIKFMLTQYPEATHLRVKRPEGKTFPAEVDQLDVPTFASLAETKKYLEARQLA